MKKVILMASLVSALFSACCASPEAGQEKKVKELSVQLYSARDLIGNPELYAVNHERVFSALKEMGISGAEAACYQDEGTFYGVAPEQFKADLEAAGLKAVSSHTGHALSAEALETGDFSKEMEWWQIAVKAHKAAGMSYVVTPGMPRPKTLAELKTYCDYYNAIGKLCKSEGLSYGYHNHNWEFETKLEDVRVIDFMLENTDPELVHIQMDVYWCVVGNCSPTEYFNKYPGRFKTLHLKDKYEVGQSGMVGFDAIFNNVETAGTEVYVLEMEGRRGEDALRAIRESAEYILKY